MAIPSASLETDFPIFSKEDARKITVPTLLIKAQNSPKWLRAIVDTLSKNMPNSSSADISSSCHFPHLENFIDFNRAVMEFLKKNNS